MSIIDRSKKNIVHLPMLRYLSAQAFITVCTYEIKAMSQQNSALSLSLSPSSVY